jgi:hypothetical protein
MHDHFKASLTRTTASLDYIAPHMEDLPEDAQPVPGSTWQMSLLARTGERHEISCRVRRHRARRWRLAVHYTISAERSAAH